MRQDFAEIYCDDCGETYYSAEYPSNQLCHCLVCDGVNVRDYSMYLHTYVKEERPDLFVLDKVQRDDLWAKIKNLNTDEEIREIQDLLFS